jgi:hypothetical protein
MTLKAWWRSTRDQQSKRERVMPHWSRIRSRNPNEPAVIHLTRPWVDFQGDVRTCCGFNRDSFIGGKSRFGVHHIPLAMQPKVTTISKFVEVGTQVTCPECFDVIDTISGWLEMKGGWDHYQRGMNDLLTHLYWRSTNFTACERDEDVNRTFKFPTIVTPAIFASCPTERCVLCTSIFDLMLGSTRREATYDRYEIATGTTVSNTRLVR